MTSQPTRRRHPAALIRLLALVALSLIAIAALLPATPVYAVPILRLRLELAPGTPSPLPSGQPFTVRLTYECSSSIGTDACTNMQVVSTLPAEFEGLQALGNNDVTLATYNPATRTATWQFRSPLPLGTTGQLEFEVRYLPGSTLDGETGVITAQITGDSAAPGSGAIIPPPASATAQPSLTKTLVAGGASSDLSLYRINLCAGTTGALNLTDSTIVDTLPPGAVYVSSEPVGVYDAGAGTVTWSGVSVPASGSGCRSFGVVVNYPAADPLNAVGATKTNSVGATTTPLGGIAQSLSNSAVHDLALPDPQLRLRKTVTGAEGTADTIVGGVITTRLTIDNIGAGMAPGGNVAINTIQITDTIPLEYNVFSVNTGAATAVAYQRNGVETWIEGVPLGANVAVTSFPSWNAGDYISRLRFSFAQLTMTERTQAVSFQSTIVNPPNGGGAAYPITALAPRNVQNTATASASYPGFPLFNQSSSATIEVALPKARPDPRKTIVSGSPALPGGTVRYEVRLRNGSFDPLVEPVIADLLPSVFSIDPASITLTKNITGCTATPSFTQVPNYQPGRTLLLWSWAGSGCGIPADDDLRLQFNVTVADGTRAGQYPNRLALVNYSNAPDLVRTSLCTPAAAEAALFSTDATLGINAARLCFSDPSNLTVRAIASIGSAKFVRGQLDSVFHRDPSVGQTVQGGLITYQMELENTGNIDLTNLQIVDILPFRSGVVQNLGVRDQATLDTAWTVQLAGPVVVTPAIPELEIYYSSELNPCREDFTADPNIGCIPMVDGVAPGPGVWSTELPSDPTAVRSLRFDFGSYALQPLEQLRFTFPAFAPVDAPVSAPGLDGVYGTSDDTNVAWNTFAYQATRDDDGSTLVAQPPRVGITVRDSPLAAYGNYVWHDVDSNGIQNEPPTRGLNGVVVRLYQVDTLGNNLLIGEQFTRDDRLGNPGFYRFGNLEPGDYFAEFATPAGYSVTSLNQGSTTEDSDVLGTLRTAITTLVAGETDLSWDAGYTTANAVSVGNRVFFDTNNDGLDNDGASGNPGSSAAVNGLTVELFLDSNGNGFLTGDEENWIAQAITDLNGYYIFTEQTRDFDGAPLGPPVPLLPGQYLIGIPASQFAPGARLDGYHSSGTTMDAAGVISELNPPDPNLGADEDDNGRMVRFDSTALVHTFFDYGFRFYNGGVLSRPVFIFDNEPVGEFHPYATLPDPNDDNRSNLTLDFGFYTASLGDLVWVDDGTGGGTLADGIRDGGEPGFANVSVELLPAAGTTVLSTTTTNASGIYSFSGLPVGNYRVRVTPPAGYVSTRDTTGTLTPNGNINDDDNGVGSDPSVTTSSVLALPAGVVGAKPNNQVNTAEGSTIDSTLDFGIVRYYSLGNRVWADSNNDGLQNNGETGINGVTLRLFQSNGSTPALRIDGTAVPNQTTANGGYYRFDLLPAGDYIVEILDTNFSGTGALLGYRSSSGPVPVQFYEPAPDPDDNAGSDDNGSLVGAVVRSLPVSLGEGDGVSEPSDDDDPLTNPQAGEAPNDQANRTVDFGFWPIFSLGNRVWDDLNNNGLLDAGEVGFGNVPVRLLDGLGNPARDATGTLVPAQQTSADGYYLFTNLLAGDYIVEIDLPNGYRSSTGDLGAYEGALTPDPDTNLDNDDNGTTVTTVIRSAVVTLSLGAEPSGEPATPSLSDAARDNNANYSVDFGLFQPMSLGNLVWNDLNNNGLVDAGEPGLANVSVRLYRDNDGNSTPDGVAIQTVTTNAAGYYLFTNLGVDTYLIEVVNPTGMLSSSGQSLPTPYEPAPDPDTLAIENDDNGTRGVGFARSAPVTLTRAGEPTDDEAITTGWTDDAANNNANYTVDFGFYTALSLGNRVWNDLNNNGIINGGESGINAVPVRLYRDNDGNNQPDDLNGGGVTIADAIATTTTNASGHYLFMGLSAGNYIVELAPSNTYRTSTGLTLPPPYEPAPDPDTSEIDSDDNGTELSPGLIRSATVTLSVGGEPIGEAATTGITDTTANTNSNLSVDFGLYRRLSLGNRVWDDLNNNGRIDTGELGLDGVTVRLYRDSDNNGTPDDLDGVAGITTTDAIQTVSTISGGYYLFTDLNQDTYIVEIVPPSAAYRSSTGDLNAYEGALTPDVDANPADNDDNGTTVGAVIRSLPVTLTDGGEPILEPVTPGWTNNSADNRSNLTVDFGLFQPMSLGNLVWNDLNNNGLIDDGANPGLVNVTVRLYRDSNNDTTPDGAAIQTIATNAAGYYLFTNLGADTYLVEVVNPAGMLSSSGQSLPTPYEPAPDPDTLAIENDDNGTRGVGFARSAPVTLTRAGEPTDDEAITTGWTDDAANNNANYTVDFGFYTALSLGNRVWDDGNNNGLIDDGASPGVDGVPVRIYRDNDGDDQPDDLNGGGVDTSDAIASVNTASGGYYRFTGLSAGDYIVEIVPPAGYRSSIGTAVAPGPYEPAPDPDLGLNNALGGGDDDTDNDDNGSTSGAVIRSATVTLSVGGEPTGESDSLPGDPTANDNSNLTLDFGIFNRVALGNLIFIDNNNNGLYELAIDAPLPGATVELLQSDGVTPANDGNGALVPSQSTGANGLYLFNNLSPGSYVVRVTPPTGYRSSDDISGSATPNNNTNNDDNGIGSSVLGAVSSNVITLTSGGEPTNDGDSDANSNLSLDFGFYQPVSVGNQIWYDTNNDGLIDGIESGISGVRVELFYDADRSGTINGGETTPIAVTTTIADGTYLFTQHTDAAGNELATPRLLTPGTYQVGIPASQWVASGPLAGLLSSGTTAGANGALSELAPPDPDDGLMPTIDGDDNGQLQSAGFYPGGVLALPLTLSIGGEPISEAPDVDPNPSDRPDANDNQTVDFGFYAMSLGNLVWRDDGSGAGGVANDGLRSVGEPALADVTVRLIAANGTTVLRTTTTDTDGRYLFAGLAEGSYMVELDRASAPLSGLLSSRDPASANDPSAQDNDDNGVTISAASVRSVTVVLDAGAAPSGESDQALSASPGMGNPAQTDHPRTPDLNSNLHIDFGFVPADWGDLPAPYVTLAAGGPHHLLTTGLRLGATIDTEPNGQPNAAATGDGADEDGVTLPTFYTGLPAQVTVQVLNSSGRPATLYGFIDFNGNGSFADAGEQVSLAAPDGTNGPLSLSFNVPSAAVLGSQLGARFRLSSDSNLGPNGYASDGEVEDYLITITPTYSLGNRVWRDLDNSGDLNAPDGASPGIGGVSVRLLDSTTLTQVTDATGALVSASTDANGYYRFDNLRAGSYLVELASANFAASQPLAGLFSSTGTAQEANPDLNVDRNDNGLDTPVAGAIRSGTITLGPANSEPTGESDPATNPESGEAPDNRSNRSVDFGFISPLSLGDLIFHDRANNGSFDGTDAGLVGATVALRDSLGNSVTDITGAAVGPQTTSDGSYLFTNLRPGSYQVLVTPPAGYRSSDDIVGSNTPNNNTNNDDNGIGDSTTGQVASALITLTSGDEPDGGESNLSLDFGFYQPLSLGDLIFHDRDNNGLFDPAIDLPLAAATVALFLDADGSGALEASNATGVNETVALASRTTLADGLYRFGDLKPGTYLTRVTPPAGYRSSDDITTTASPNNDVNNDDNGSGNSLLGPVASALITLNSGEEPQESGFANLTLDFGFYQLVSLGDLIFEDFADDGLFNGADVPLAGALVELRFENGDPATDITGGQVANQTTGANGLYLFSNLKPGAYVVRVAPPAGAGYRSSTDRASSATPDNDINLDDNGLDTGASATSNPLTLRSGDEPTTDGDDANSNLTLDFGFHRSLSLGNRVFLDTNNDGLDNDGDGTPGSSSGLANIPVRLYRDSASDGTPDGLAIQTTATNATGHYLFVGLIADSYIVEIVPPAGYRSSTGDLGAYEPAPDADANASDYDDNGFQFAPAAIRSAPITLAPGTEPSGEPATPGLADSTPDESANYTLDFGLYQPLSLGNRVFVDANNDGLDNDGPGGATGSADAITNWPVRLYRDSNNDGNPDGAAIQTVATNTDGYYLFSDLGADSYLVELDLPAGMLSSSGLTLPAPYEPALDPDSNQSDFDDNGTSAGTIVRSAPVTLSVGGTPTGEPATPGFSDSASDANANYTVDFGFYTALSLGNRVWNDVDNSGALDLGELGLDNVSVRLYRNNNGDGQPDDLNGDTIADQSDAIATITTSDGGYYLFTGLSAGGYLVEIVPPTGYRSSTGPAGIYEPAIMPAGSDSVDHGGELVDVIRSATITLSVGGAPTGESASPDWPDLTADNNANLTLDFGLYRALSLGNLVFFDRDNNGRYDPAVDLPLEGASLRLFEGDGTTRARDTNGIEVPDETSDADGLYRFNNLSPGSYVVRVTPPAGYRSSDDIATTATPDNDDNDDDNGIGDSIAGNVFSVVISLIELGEPTNDGDSDNNSNLTLDFGFYRPLSLGDLVFHDRANDGSFDSTDVGLAGATVELRNGSGNPVTDITGAAVGPQTTSDGSYLFTNLKPGDYVVRIAPPAGYRSSDDIATTATPNNNTNNDDNGIGGSVTTPVTSDLLTLRSGDEPDGGGDRNLTLDFGFYQPLSLGDLVFHDRDNDGRYDPAIDSSLEDATVTLYLDDGVTRAEDADGVELIELTTDATGSYRFTNLKPGRYTVSVNPPEGYRSSDDITTTASPNNDENNDDNGLGGEPGEALSALITLSSGEEPQESGFANLALDFGFYQLVSLGDLIFEDFANDGLFNGADAPLAGALVELRFADGSPASDAAGDLVVPWTTLDGGLYFFGDLKPGRYSVRVTAPAGYTSSDDSTATADPDNDLNLDDNGVNDPASLNDNRSVASSPLTLRSGDEPDNAVDDDGNESNLTLDFGFFRPSALGNRVWLDLNRDGLQAADELDGVPGVTVTLYAADGVTVLASTTTDSAGLYRFERLGARDYLIGFSLPLGYQRSPAGQGGSPAGDSNADPSSGRTPLINLPTATSDPSWDAGLFYTAGLGNRVWFDRNANGLQDAGERGVPAVPVTLYAADGVTIVRTTNTDADGFYYFDNLAPGNYLIAFMPPVGYELSPSNRGSNRDGDSDPDPVSGRTALISLAPGQADPSWDAGLFQRVRLGNLVWEDTNNNGRRDPGERGLASVALRLFADSNSDGQPDGAASASTTTDSQGLYLFTNLVPGDYLVEITPPAGYVSSSGLNGSASGPYEPTPDPSGKLDSTDSGTRLDATVIRSGVIRLWSLSAPEPGVDGDDANGNLTMDFGLFRPAALGSLVWYDRNGDGRRDGGEPGTSNVRVSLLYVDGTPVRDAAGRPLSLATDTDGGYLFDYLTPGSYLVHFGNLPTGYTFTAPGSDSDADPLSGQSPAVSLAPGERNMSLWAGLINPTAITLISFSATPETGGIVLRWATADERDSWGFHLLRSADGSRAGAVRVTPQRILARGEPQLGASYSWADASAAPGIRYSYWLQEVEIGGRINEYGPATATLDLSETNFRILLPLVWR